MPSWNTSVASVGTEPGAMPPTSWWWVMVAANASGRPRANTGITTAMSGRCVPPR